MAKAPTPPVVHYLEQPVGRGEKFVEVTLEGARVVVVTGRIGAAGTPREQAFKTTKQAAAHADHQVAFYAQRGFAPAVKGARRPAPPAVPRGPAPVLWRFASGAKALGLWVDDVGVWVGNQDGAVFALDHEGEVRARYALPAGVKGIVADDVWRYAGADDGRVYDLSGRAPRVAYEVAAGTDVLWLDVREGALAVSDGAGAVSLFDHEGELRWTRPGAGGADGWMVRCDDDTVYHGDAAGVAAYALDDGAARWSRATHGRVLFGCLAAGHVYACTDRGRVHRFARDGSAEATFVASGAVYSCAATPDGRFVFAGDDAGAVYCYNEAGDRLWKLATGCGAANSMQHHGARLYLVTTEGLLACVDASDEAIARAATGVVPAARALVAPAPPAPPATPAAPAAPFAALERATDASAGVVVECYRDGPRGLKVRVVSPGYEPGWNCQFPKDIRVEGQRYLVDAVRPSRGYYRVHGDIRALG